MRVMTNDLTKLTRRLFLTFLQIKITIILKHTVQTVIFVLK